MAKCLKALIVLVLMCGTAMGQYEWSIESGDSYVGKFFTAAVILDNDDGDELDDRCVVLRSYSSLASL